MDDNEENIEDLCYTSNNGRQHFDYRIVVSGNNASKLCNALEKSIKTIDDSESMTKKVINNGSGISQNLEIYAENASNIRIPAKVYETVKELLSTKNIFKAAFETCESEIQKNVEDASLKRMIEEKNTNDNVMTQLFTLSFYYSLQ